MRKVLFIRETDRSNKRGLELIQQHAGQRAKITVESIHASKKVNYGKKQTKERLAEIIEAHQDADEKHIITDKHRKLFESFEGLKISPNIERYQIPSWLKKWEGRSQKDNSYELVSDISRLDEIKRQALHTGLFSFDYETTGLDLWAGDEPTMISISVQPGYSFVVPFTDFFYEGPHGLSYDQFFPWFKKEIVSNENIEKIAHNIDFEFQVGANKGIEPYEYKGVLHDTMIQAHLIDENLPNHKLKDLIRKEIPEYAGYDKELNKKDPNVWTNTPLPKLSKYASLDSDLTLRLFLHYTGKLLEDAKLYRNYRNIGMPARKELSQATCTGLPINREFCRKLIDEGEKDLAYLDKKIRQLPEVKKVIEEKLWEARNEQLEILEGKRKKHKPGSHYYQHYTKQIVQIKHEPNHADLYDWSPTSPEKVADVLYSAKGINAKPTETKDGVKFTTDKYALHEKGGEFGSLLLTHRTISKMLSTYYKPLYKMSEGDGRVHGQFRSTGTVTGRLSSANPNLQNMPSRLLFPDEMAIKYVKGIKNIFTTPTENDVFGQVDYSQAELRMVANFSRDANMIKTFQSNIDIHSVTGARLAMMSLKDFIESENFKEYRFKAKSANFGIIYGISVGGYMHYVYQNTGRRITKKEAEHTIKQFFKLYPGLKGWHKKYANFAKDRGYVRTLFGRKRRVGHYYKMKGGDYLAESKAINSPIQGSAGEWALFCIGLRGKILDREKCAFVNTIHDSLFDFIDRAYFETATTITKIICEKPPLKTYFDINELPAPMKVDFTFSNSSWGEMEEYEDLRVAAKEFQK